jgi:hypothetical protein
MRFELSFGLATVLLLAMERGYANAAAISSMEERRGAARVQRRQEVSAT